jgi:hypothetical protein
VTILRTRRYAAAAVAAGIGAGVLAGCGSSGGGSTQPSPTPTLTAAQTQALIKSNWDTFFRWTTPQATKVALLQTGTAGAAAITKAATFQSAKIAKMKATGVVVQPDGQSALVTYNIYIHGQPVISGGTGNAVYENGQWKVSQAAFCSLVSQGGHVPGCG